MERHSASRICHQGLLREARCSSPAGVQQTTRQHAPRLPLVALPFHARQLCTMRVKPGCPVVQWRLQRLPFLGELATSLQSVLPTADRDAHVRVPLAAARRRGAHAAAASVRHGELRGRGCALLP